MHSMDFYLYLHVSEGVPVRKKIKFLTKAVYYGVRIGTSTLSEFNKSSQVPTTRKKF